MSRSRLRIVALILAVLSASAWADVAIDPAAARRLLDRAVKEVADAPNPDFDVLIQLSRDLARFDRPTASGLLARALKLAEATKKQETRLLRLEMVALSAAPVEEGVSTAALSQIKVPDVWKKDPRIGLKMLAIELVLTRRHGLPGDIDLIERTKTFCEKHKTIWQIDVGAGSHYAFADYVSRMDVEIGRFLWEDMQPERAWKGRYELLNDLIHYRSGHAVPVARELVKSAQHPREKEKAAAALYRAGAETEALDAVLHLVKPLIGEGQPIGDLIEAVAVDDPEKATELVLGLKSPRSVMDGLDMVARGAVVKHPEAVPDVAKHMTNAVRHDYALERAAAALARKGKIKEARKMTRLLRRPRSRWQTELAVAGGAGDHETVIRLVTGKGKAERPDNVWIWLRRSVGFEKTKETILAIYPELRGNWKNEKFFSLLMYVCRDDPAWALDLLKRGPDEPARNTSGKLSVSLSWVLARTAPLDPDFVAEYIKKHGAKEDRFERRYLIGRCALMIAETSVERAEAFQKHLWTPDNEGDRPPARREELVKTNWATRIAAAADKANDVLLQSPFQSKSSRREVLRNSLSRLPDGGARNVPAILKLIGALDERETADYVLRYTANNSWRDEEDALKLIDAIKSPWVRAGTLCDRAEHRLDPRPRLHHSILMGWHVRQEVLNRKEVMKRLK